MRVPDSPVPPADAGAVPARHHERLGVPLRWWVQGTMLVATLWLAFVVATPARVAWSATGVLLLAMALLFVVYGSARIEVEDGWFRAGRARIAGEYLGGAEPLDAEETRRVAGPEADARAYLLLRPYLKRAVRVPSRRPRPGAVLAGQHPAPRGARRRRHRDLDSPLTPTPPGGLGGPTAR